MRSIEELRLISSGLLEQKSGVIVGELRELLAQKEQLDRLIEKKRSELQEAKYGVFSELEATITDESELASLHKIKLESIDLYDVLNEMIESAIIVALERSQDAELEEMIEESIRDLTYETIIGETLSTLRVRKILSTILQTSVEVAEATPNQLERILEPTIRGMRQALFDAIRRFKQRLAFMPLEAKHILIKDYDTIVQDLSQSDVLFSQVVQGVANKSDLYTKRSLLAINKKMHYDLLELLELSKETVVVMKNRFSDFAKSAAKKADYALNSTTANEAKKLGIEAYSKAKATLATAIKSAKNRIER